MRCKMKVMLMDMCILSHKTQCFFDVRTRRRCRRGQTEGFYRNITIFDFKGKYNITFFLGTMGKLKNVSYESSG